MTDIVEQLRSLYVSNGRTLNLEAATDIERLRGLNHMRHEEIERLQNILEGTDRREAELRAALQEIAAYYATGAVRLNSDVDVPEIAHRALEPKP